MLKQFQRGWSRTPLGGLLILLVLLLNLMAASPRLHEFFHADAGKAEHQCAVTLFAHGQVDSACVDVAVALPVLFVQASPSLILSAFAPAIEHLPAGRAPPLSAVPLV